MKLARAATLTLAAASLHAAADDCSFPLVSSLSGQTRDVGVSGDHAYACLNEGGLLVINVADPDNPTYGTTLDTPCTDIEIVGQTGFLSTGAGMTIIDLSTPGAPALVGSIEPAGASIRDVAINGSTAYLLDYPNKVRIVDISNPAAPSQVSAFIVSPDQMFDIKIDGTTLYAVIRDVGLAAFDVSNPLAVGHLSTLTISGSSSEDGQDVAIVGDRAYYAQDQSNIFVVDITDPSSMSITGSADVAPQNPGEIEVVGSVAYVADSSSTYVYDLTNPDAPTLIDSDTTFPDRGGTICVAGSLAFIPDVGDNPGVHIVDVSTPSNMTKRSLAAVPESLADLAVVGDVAFVLADDALLTFDIATPGVTSLIASIPAEGSCSILDGGYLFTAGGSFGQPVTVYDVSDPANPTAVAETNDDFTNAFRIAQGNGALYLVDYEYDAFLQVVDISDPLNPALATTIPVTSIYDAVVVGDVLYTTGVPGLSAYDISSPLAPVLLDTQNLPDIALALAVIGDTAIALTTGPNVTSIDVSDPANLAGLDIEPTAFGFGSEILVIGTTAYIDTYAGLHAVDVSNPASLAIELIDADLTLGPTAIVGDRLFCGPGFTEREIVCVADCPADFDDNGTLNIDDIDAFVAAFLASDLSADFDANGTLNIDDIDAFVASFLSGC